MTSDRCTRFFISANGGDGFFSLYDQVFQNEGFSKIFVIHGGPGTGKSTLMRKISEYGRAAGAECQEILCSSDPSSLDGVILSKNGKRVGVLDGTSPHPRIVSVPGAKEILWNLGEFWDERTLSSLCDEIKTNNQRKKEWYRRGYAFLRVAAAAHEENITERRQRTDTDKIKEYVLRRVKRLSSFGEGKKRLFRALSMQGEYLEASAYSSAKNYVILTGKKHSAEIFLSVLERALAQNHISHTLFLSPLSADSLDAILVEETKTLYLWDGFLPLATEGKRLHLNRYQKSLTPVMNALLRTAEKLENTAIDTALSAFRNAGEAHFALEKIYRGAMDFEKMKQKSEKWIGECLAELEK